jgi:head-tail adaptor
MASTTPSRWISAGNRHRRVEIQTRTTGPGGAVTWTTRATRWAQIEMLVGQEQIEASQLVAGKPGRITLAWDPMTAAIVESDRLKCGARIFEVDSVVNVLEQNRQLELTVQEQVS